jgi:hypothetical protein
MVPGAARAVFGSVVLPQGTVLATTDTIPLFTLGSGGGAHIVGLYIDAPALGGTVTMNLRDSLATPTVIIAASNVFQAGGALDETAAAHGTLGAGVTYTVPSQILLAPAAAGTALASPMTIYFVFTVASG